MNGRPLYSAQLLHRFPLSISKCIIALCSFIEYSILNASILMSVIQSLYIMSVLYSHQPRASRPCSSPAVNLRHMRPVFTGHFYTRHSLLKTPVSLLINPRQQGTKLHWPFFHESYVALAASGDSSVSGMRTVDEDLSFWVALSNCARRALIRLPGPSGDGEATHGC